MLLDGTVVDVLEVDVVLLDGTVVELGIAADVVEVVALGTVVVVRASVVGAAEGGAVVVDGTIAYMGGGADVGSGFTAR
ncbi:MAG: hypothetical protein M0Z47_00890 [Actinomycetota bacterium]|nr:hypothetical protein [Actinomycetota bacterium]